jgi:hypothetical protein
MAGGGLKGAEMKKFITIEISAKQYEDYDDCLAAATDDYVSEHPEAEGYDMDARWSDDDRDVILLDVPA